MLKKCTNADITSFKVKKFVLEVCSGQVIYGKKYETQNIRPSLQRVIKYWTMKVKFKNDDQALANIGVEKIVVTDGGLHFIRYTYDMHTHSIILYFRNDPGDVKLMLGIAFLDA